MYDFVALDVETANESPGSICKIGLAKYRDFQLVDTWATLIDPQDYFSALNCAIHGISPEDVRGAPTFGEVFSELARHVEGYLLLHHTHFDRTALGRACAQGRIDTPTWFWLDTARVARRTWEKFQRKGYGLASLCEHIGFEFRHHDPVEDAKAAGAIFTEACKVRGVNPKDWLEMVKAPITARATQKGDNGTVNPDGPLFGEVICFTGSLETLTRNEAEQLAKQAGCKVGGVTRKTTLLVQGDQDILRSRGETVSNKMRKAEEYARKGQMIRLLRESDFLELVGGI